MGDWGRSQLYIHRITPDGPSFTQKQENFISISQFTDVDVDGSGRIGNAKTSIENVMLSLGKIKANKQTGQKVLAKLACTACHNIKPTDPIKGPNFNKVGARLSKEQIAEAILKPAATIADSWVTVTMHNGTIHQGTLVSKDTSKVVIHNIAGIATTLKTPDVKGISKQTSTLMGPGLANDLSLKQFADLVEYLHSLK